MALHQTIYLPDIGTADSVDVIEVLVKVGDAIQVDTPLLTLESAKATMEIPSSETGMVQSIAVKVGDKVSQGDPILVLSVESETVVVETPKVEPVVEVSQQAESLSFSEASTREEKVMPSPVVASSASSSLCYAAPSIRRMARQLGVSLQEVVGTGPKSRITKDDVEAYVKEQLSAPKLAAHQVGLPVMPVIDFSEFGPIEAKPRHKLKRLTGIQVHHAWTTIPHVTQFDEADITDLESFRVLENQKTETVKLTLLAFAVKVVSHALLKFPSFNASLSASGEDLIYKKYVNIGIAVETQHGLVVPVIRDVDRRSIRDIAEEMTRLSKKAREKGLMPQDMRGGCFTISSLGGIGGTGFTPIVNAPEVAILGLSRSVMKPVYQDHQFVPRLMLPLSLSYDHRVIDGAEAARFTRYIAECLHDIRKIL